VKIGLAQIDCRPGDVTANLAKVADVSAEAKAAGCDLVLFPEASDTGYVPSQIAHAPEIETGEAFDRVGEVAARHGICVICGLSERVGEETYSTMACFGGKGQLLQRYRKTHLFSLPPADESRYWTPGDKLAHVTMCGSRWGLSICFDLRFPELYRALAIQGCEVLVNVAAWPAARAAHWDSLVRARAIENQAYVVAVNRVGKDGDTALAGCSRIISPAGDVIADGSANDEVLVVGELDMDLVAETRSTMPVLSARRTDLYGNLEPAV
jgi:omega-amidase